MSPEAILDLLKREQGEHIVSVDAASAHPHAIVNPTAWHDIARFLRDDERLRFDWLRCISGVDHIEEGLITVVYELHAVGRPQSDAARQSNRNNSGQSGGFWPLAGEIAIKLRVPRDDAHVPSVADIWPAADWHERETYDLLGVIFDGHPNLKRILCCDDWEGHPLRRDYEFPLEFHGIPAVTELNQTRPQQ